MINVFSTAAALAVAVAPLVKGQTFSACNPLQKSGCPADPGLNSATYTADFTTGVPSEWKLSAGNVTTGSNGAEFAIKSLTDGPTLQSNFYILFGRVEAVVQAAPGQGIVSSFILESDDLDEIDWEIIGSQTTQAQSNFFGKGNTTTYDRGQFHPVTSPATTFHTYAVDWKQDTTTWSIDGQVVRTLNFADALALGGKNYPQTPMNIRLGNWVAGQPSNNPGTVQWAGGLADLSKGPFNMFVKSITVTSYTVASSYTYGDQSGTWQSIKVNQGTNNEVASSSSRPKTSSSRSNSGNVRASSVLGNSRPSVITIVPSGRGSSPSATSVVGNSNNNNAATITVNVQGGSAGGSSQSTQAAAAAGGLGSTITVNVAGVGASSTMAFGLGASSTRPAQVTTNDATRQTRQPLLALTVLLLLTLFSF